MKIISPAHGSPRRFFRSLNGRHLRSRKSFRDLYQALLLSSALATSIQAASLAENLVVNGNAETASTVGWEGANIATTLAVQGPKWHGLPPHISIGRYSFWGGSGPIGRASLTQTIDVSDLGGRIDSEPIGAVFSALLQSRRIAAGADTAEVKVEFLSQAADILYTKAWKDEDYSGPSEVAGGDWEQAADIVLTPTGTRSIRISLSVQRTIGITTDAYFDNIGLRLFALPFIADIVPIGGKDVQLTLVSRVGSVCRLERTIEPTLAPVPWSFVRMEPDPVFSGLQIAVTNYLDLDALTAQSARFYRLSEQ